MDISVLQRIKKEEDDPPMQRSAAALAVAAVPSNRSQCCCRFKQRGQLQQLVPELFHNFLIYLWKKRNPNKSLLPSTPVEQQEDQPTRPAGSSKYHKDDRCFITIGIGTRCIQALVDTGVMHSFVGRVTSEWCRQRGWGVRADNYIATFANGFCNDISEIVIGTVNIQGRDLLATPFYILDSLDSEALIGMDVLSRLGLRLILAGETIFPPTTSSAGKVGVATWRAVEAEIRAGYGAQPEGNIRRSPKEHPNNLAEDDLCDTDDVTDLDLATISSCNEDDAADANIFNSAGALVNDEGHPSGASATWTVLLPDGFTVEVPYGRSRWQAFYGEWKRQLYL